MTSIKDYAIVGAVKNLTGWQEIREEENKMDLWRATEEEIAAASLKYFGKLPTEIRRQTGLWVYVSFGDGAHEIIYGWMVN